MDEPKAKENTAVFLRKNLLTDANQDIVFLKNIK